MSLICLSDSKVASSISKRTLACGLLAMGIVEVDVNVARPPFGASYVVRMAPSVPGGTTQFGDHTPMRPKLLIASPGSAATTDVKEPPRSAAAAIPVTIVECFKPSTSGQIRDHGLGRAFV